MAGPGTRRVATGFPAFRLFVFGVEITDEVSNYSVTLDDGRQPSTMVFTLPDPVRRWTVTAADMESMFPTIKLSDIDDPIVRGAFAYAQLLDTQGLHQEALAVLAASAGQQIQEYSLGRVRKAIFDGVADSVKATILAAKASTVLDSDAPFKGVSLGGDATRLISGNAGVADIVALTGKPLRYPFAPFKCVFHANDPVRLFERDPWTGRWFYGFSGFGTTFTRNAMANGQESWTITCEDPLRIMRRARIALNPSIADPGAVIKGADASLRSFFSEGMVGVSMPEYVMTMFFGPDLLKVAKTEQGSLFGTAQPPVSLRIGANGSSTTERTNELGAGYFNFDSSRVYLFGPKPDKNEEVSEQWPPGLQDKVITDDEATLNAWQVDVDHSVRLSDLFEMVVPELEDQLASTESSCTSTVIDRDGNPVQTVDMDKLISTIGLNPHMFPVDRGRVMMLMPRSLGAAGASDVLLRDVVQGAGMLIAWKTRLGLLYDIVQRLDMSMYATPKGDILIEMPLYDYDPEAFDSTDNTAFSGSPSASDLNSKHPESFSDRYRWATEDTVGIDDTHNDEGVRTVVRATYNLIPNFGATGTSSLIGDAALAYAAHLIPQYGLRMEEVTPRAQVASPEAAEALAHLTLNKLNADAESMSVAVVPALGIGPNRPQYFDDLIALGTCRNIQRTFTWGVSGNASMKLNVNYVRRWNGHLRKEDGAPMFSTIAGFGGRPFNWALLFAAPSAKAAESAPAPHVENAAMPGEGTTAPLGQTSQTTVLDDAQAKAAIVAGYAQTVMLPWLAARGAPALVGSTWRSLEADLELQRQGRVNKGWDLTKSPSPHQKGLAVDFRFNPTGTPGTVLAARLSEFAAGPGLGRIHNVYPESDHIHVNFVDPSKWPG